MDYTERAFSLTEVLIYITITAILSFQAYLGIKSLLLTYQKNALSKNISSSTNKLIRISRISHQNSSIYVGHIRDHQYLIFKVKDEVFNAISLRSKYILRITLKSGSLFKDHIFIDHSGYVSPSSVQVIFCDNTKLSITISRLGHIALTWN